ncbi:glycosyltransferase family 4 protein [Rossellomorea vietnamensis]|uniref:glycosyltransferase family 4 protein n=1 Tax=Rossellomorea vietnamensis TaxID=218284 RepID=UPI001E5D0146|nr:glycosyltransferase family 4 protein [Rossellomorea vietnamensis]MCC5803216.1 glycosyltransferase family 4 protein [Rossellomorea vietnamensis]
MIKMLYLTNIPTPYRNKRFNLMSEIFKDYNIDLTVYYMAETESDRHWDVNLMNFSHKHFIDKGFYKNYKGIHWHFNPKLLKLIKKNNFEIVVVGGIASPTHWITPFLLRKNQCKILSVESNPFSEVRKSKAARVFKAKLLDKYDAFQVTGERAVDYISQISNESGQKTILKLPNLIDEDSLMLTDKNKKEIRKQIRQRYQIKDTEQLWVCPARLEPVKGLDIFLPSTKKLENVKILVAGDGKEKNKLEDMVKTQKLPVEFLGHVDPNQMANLYYSADLFVLPSIQDPSPLSPIEASYIGLPMLLSTRIGNFDDVFVEKKSKNNGWSFDPYNRKALSNILIEISKTNKDKLCDMGKLSKINYEEKFNLENCLNNYAKQILKVSNDCNLQFVNS